MAVEEEDSTPETALLLHRHFQRILHETFWSAFYAARGAHAFSAAEVRLEAALRAWVRTLDVSLPPPAGPLPDEAALEILASRFDAQYGDGRWWAWAVWSSCGRCKEVRAVRCSQCSSYVRFFSACGLDEGITTDPAALDSALCSQGVGAHSERRAGGEIKE